MFKTGTEKREQSSHDKSSNASVLRYKIFKKSVVAKPFCFVLAVHFNGLGLS